MLIQLWLLKGRRNRDNPSGSLAKLRSVVTPPSFCLIIAILALAFRDIAFASKWVRDHQDIYSVDIPDRLRPMPIRWAENWKKVPVLRRSVRDSTGEAYASPELAS